jgi:type I restriction enzyme S subunit
MTEMLTPEGWQWIPMTEVAQLETGHTPSRKHPEYWDGDIPWIGIKDARQHHGQVINETLQQVTQLGLDHSASRLLPERTVCLSRTASVGYSLIMGRPMATSQDFVNWLCSDVLDPEFLMQLFIAEKESLLTFGKGTTHTTIYFPEVKAFHVCLPPLAEQRRIVSKIESLQERSSRARRALSEVGPLLAQFRQSVLRAAFSGRLTADWRAANPDVEPASELLSRIRTERRHRWEQSELAKYEAKGKQPPNNWRDKYKEPEPVDEPGLPELPDGWCWTRAEGVCEYITKGTTPPKGKMTQDGGDVRFLKVGNLTFTGALDFAKENAYIDAKTHNTGVYSRSRIYPGDVLMNLVGPPLGKVSLIPPEIEQSNVNQAVAIFRPINGLRATYLTLALTTPSILERIVSRAKQTSGQRNLTLDLSRGLPLPLAPSEEQAEIVRLAQFSLDLIDSLEAILAESESDLTQLDQSILAKAFRGELVRQDPRDEPASELLARIRQQREARTTTMNEIKPKRPIKKK